MDTSLSSLELSQRIRHMVGYSTACDMTLAPLIKDEDVDHRRPLVVITAVLSVFSQLHAKLMVNKRYKSSRKEAGNHGGLDTEFIAKIFSLITDMVPDVRRSLLTYLSESKRLLLALRLEIRRIIAQISINQLRQIQITANIESKIFPSDWTMRILRQAVFKYVESYFELQGDVNVPLKMSPNVDGHPKVRYV